MSKTTMTSRQFQAILALAEQKGLTAERTTAILKSGILADVFDHEADLSDRPAVRNALRLGAIKPDTFILTVDYGTQERPRNLEEMICAGLYGLRNMEVHEGNFPIRGDGKQSYEAKLFHFNYQISSSQAEREIKASDLANPWKSARIEHLLAFGEKFPDEQRKYSVISLGSSAGLNADQHVPCLRMQGSERQLSIGWRGNGWAPQYRFLAIRRIKGH